MEAKVNFALVGLFVLILGLGLIAGVLWLGSGKQFGKDYETYVVYVNESVSGLNLNAPVKYRGVDVGSVTAIDLDPKNPERVRLTLDIERGTPVREDTVALLRTQGLTGIAYVDLMGGSGDSPRLAAKAPEKHPVIRSAPSLMARIDDVLPRLLANVERISVSLNAVLDEENRQTIRQVLTDTAAITRTLAARTETIDAGIRDAARTLENTARASADLSRLVERIEQSAAAMERMADHASETLVQGRDGMRQLAGEILPELNALVGEMREVAGSLRRTGREIERNPAILLHGKEPAKPGPGE